MSGGPAQRAQYLEALGIDRYVRRQASAPPAAAALTAPATPAPAPAPALTDAHADARAIVAAPRDSDPRWEPLAAEVRTCTLCALHAGRTQTVFGVGNRHADLLVVGEAPGADEDRQGEPFVGRAGQLLNSMLRAMRAPRETVYIANVLKCRPPGNRDPAPEEVRCCLPYLQRQIELIAPRLMLAVGRIAAQNLLATDTPIGKLRGAVHRFGPEGTPLIVTYHPAYLLRSPSEKRKSWIDLRFVQRELARLGAPARTLDG
jgi:uracil-DNA glycosylase